MSNVRLRATHGDHSREFIRRYRLAEQWDGEGYPDKSQAPAYPLPPGWPALAHVPAVANFVIWNDDEQDYVATGETFKLYGMADFGGVIGAQGCQGQLGHCVYATDRRAWEVLDPCSTGPVVKANTVAAAAPATGAAYESAAVGKWAFEFLASAVNVQALAWLAPEYETVAAGTSTQDVDVSTGPAKIVQVTVESVGTANMKIYDGPSADNVVSLTIPAGTGIGTQYGGGTALAWITAGQVAGSPELLVEYSPLNNLGLTLTLAVWQYVAADNTWTQIAAVTRTDPVWIVSPNGDAAVPTTPTLSGGLSLFGFATLAAGDQLQQRLTAANAAGVDYTAQALTGVLDAPPATVKAPY